MENAEKAQKEEVKPKTQKEEKALSILEQAKLEKQELEKISERVAGQIDELRSLRADEILSGKGEIKKPEKPKEQDPQEYAQLALEGKLNNK